MGDVREITVRIKEKYQRHNENALREIGGHEKINWQHGMLHDWNVYLSSGDAVLVKVVDDEHVTITGECNWHLSLFDIVGIFNIGDAVTVRSRNSIFYGDTGEVTDIVFKNSTSPKLFYRVSFDTGESITYAGSSLALVKPEDTSGTEEGEPILKYADTAHSWDDWNYSVLYDPGTPTHAEDEVNNPDHYTSHPTGIEAIDVCEYMNFNLGNVIKYVWRAGKKGDAMTDLLKARWYINREIERLGGDIGSK